MKYTINGKHYTEFDINKRCAELLGLDVSGATASNNRAYNYVKDYCNNPQVTWPIIEKCWDELMEVLYVRRDTTKQWNHVIRRHNCTKLVAACICFIEMNKEQE